MAEAMPNEPHYNRDLFCEVFFLTSLPSISLDGHKAGRANDMISLKFCQSEIGRGWGDGEMGRIILFSSLILYTSSFLDAGQV